MSSRFGKASGWLRGGVLFLLGAAVTGVIGNRVDALAVDTSPWLGRQLTREIPFWWLLSALLLGIGLALLWRSSERGREEGEDKQGVADLRLALAVEREAANRTGQLVRMGDTLLRLLASLDSGNQRELEVKRALEEYLRDATGVFGGEVSRGIVLLRQGTDLEPWIGFQMPQATIERSRFRIAGQGREAPGIAGRAFISGEVQIVHFFQDGERFISDQPNDYIVFDDARPFPPYRSFIAVPIRGSGSIQGVVCFDSMRVDVFDAIEIQSLVITMARQIGYAMEIGGVAAN